jgi:hypothetical protein
MASEEQANRARKQHGRTLMERGVHAIGVEAGKNGWTVVAHVEPGKVVTLPQSLPVSSGGKNVTVPLKIRRSAGFALE